MARKFISHLLSFIFFLSACAPAPLTAASPTVTKEAVPSPTATVTPAPVSTLGVEASALRGVNIMVWHPWFGPEASLFETQVADFNAANEWGITVLTAGQSNYTELFTNVSASLAAPDKPDLVVGLPEQALVWDQSSSVVNLTPYVNDPLWGMSADDLADFSPVFLAQDVVGDKRLGMPAQRTTRMMFYNQTWARELGFNAPPVTPEEFREQACKANASFRTDTNALDDGLGGWLVDTDPMTAMGFLFGFGGGPLEGEGYRFLAPKNIEAFKFAKSLYESGCAFRLTDTAPVDVFASRRALFITASLEDIPAQSRAFLTAARADEWTLLPFPGGAQTMAVYGSSYIALASTPEKQLAAWLFMRWMLQTDNQARWVSTTGMLPLRTSTLNLVADYAAAYPQWVDAVKLLPEAQGTPRLASWRKVRLLLGDGFEFMFRVDKPEGQVAAILAEMDRAVQGLGE